MQFYQNYLDKPSEQLLKCGTVIVMKFMLQTVAERPRRVQLFSIEKYTIIIECLKCPFIFVSN